MRTIIKTRIEFDSYLVDARDKMKALVQSEPNDKTLGAVLRQLEAIQQWTSNGADLTAEEKKRIVMGLRAHREMQDFPVEQDLVLALNNYIENTMPTAPPTA